MLTADQHKELQRLIPEEFASLHPVLAAEIVRKRGYVVHSLSLADCAQHPAQAVKRAVFNVALSVPGSQADVADALYAHGFMNPEELIRFRGCGARTLHHLAEFEVMGDLEIARTIFNHHNAHGATRAFLLRKFSRSELED